MKIKIFSLLTFTIIMTCMLAGFISDQKSPQFLSDSSQAIQKVIQEQHDNHQKALRKIKQEFAISDEQWNVTFDYINMLKTQDTLLSKSNIDIPKTEDPFLQKIYTIFNDYKINPARVEIKNLQGPEYKAQAFQEIDEQGIITHILELNSQWLDNFPLEIQEGMLRHEIMHLVNYDCLEESYLMGLLESLGSTEKEYSIKESMINYRRHREIRADLLACCNNSEVANALRYYYDACALESEHYKPQTWNTHPTDRQRAQELAQLLSNMVKTANIQA